jgi:predicted metal-dependent HD superfamily phosphohydrolase
MLFTIIKDTVLQHLIVNLPDNLRYHDQAHTTDVIRAARQYGTMAGLDEASMDILLTASLLHETGIIEGYQGHEQASVRYARKLLPAYGYSVEQIDNIGQLILETTIPQAPTTLLSKILCDADLDYLGRPDYFAISHKLRLEWMFLNNYPESLNIWYAEQLVFLQNHKYFTAWATETRSKGLAHNISLIKALLAIS